MTAAPVSTHGLPFGAMGGDRIDTARGAMGGNHSVQHCANLMLDADSTLGAPPVKALTFGGINPVGYNDPECPVACSSVFAAWEAFQ